MTNIICSEAPPVPSTSCLMGTKCPPVLEKKQSGNVVAIDGVTRKIEALFRRRQVDFLAQSILGDEKFAYWQRDAWVVQRDIYVIDYHYEQSESVHESTDRPFWQALDTRLAGIDGGNSALVSEAVHDLTNYAAAERRIHEFDPIDTREFSAILQLKCADVRLARSLAWIQSGLPLGSASLRFWTIYDQCWELIEDVQDLGEDGRDWNFNFWLYSYMAGGAAAAGISTAAALLQRMVSELQIAILNVDRREQSQCGLCLSETICALNSINNSIATVLQLCESGQVLRFRGLREGSQFPTLGRL